MTQSKVAVDLSGLDKFIKEVGKDYVTKVGLVGSGGSQDHGDDFDNAGIGLVQEFGSASRNIPPRSFLRMPIETKQKELLGTMQKFMDANKGVDGFSKRFYNLLGVTAVKYIQEAFSTGGWGSWPDNADSTARAKNSAQPLIDTGQLRRAIDFEVVKRKDGN